MTAEDDLRTIIAPYLSIPVYARLIPPDLPDCVSVQAVGGRTTTAGIRRAVDTVSLIVVHHDRETAISILRTVRDRLVESLPVTVNGTRYYLAEPLADGSLKRKGKRGPAYIEYVDLEVTRSL